MPIASDVLIAVIAAIPALIVAIIAWRKVPAERETAQSQADRAQHEATKTIAEGAKTLAESLQVEIEKLKRDLEIEKTRATKAEALVSEFQPRMAKAEERIAQSEKRAADAEHRAAEFRADLIRVGTMLDQSRKEHKRQIAELVLIIQNLMEQIETLGLQPNIDKEVLARLADFRMSNHTDDPIKFGGMMDA